MTFDEGINGYHQMSVMGEALLIRQNALLQLAKVAALSEKEAKQIIDRHCEIAAQFSSLAKAHFDGLIRSDTLSKIQKKLNKNSKAARS